MYKLALAWVAASVVVGCGGRAQIFVECKQEGAAFVCTAEHIKGMAAGKACFDLVFACQNGTTARKTTCQVVEPKSKAVVRIETKDIKNFDQCDVITQSGVENLKVTRP